MPTGEYNPDTMEIESRLREGLRDILQATPDVRDNALLAEVRRLKKDLADYESSFNLYDRAQRELNALYAAAHPSESDIHFHDAGKISRWAADRLRRIEGAK